MESRNLLRQLPAVDQLLQHPRLKDLSRENYKMVLALTRQVLDDWRLKIKNGATTIPDPGQLAREIENRYHEAGRSSLRPVINATGVVLHTNLGRAILSPAARAAALTAAGRYTNLEYDLEKGQRGNRYSHVTGLLKELTGAEEALVVNNNAAAVLLALSTLAAGRETIISRGQLVEIGGSFRIPEVMGQSGTRLVEVGTTNKTYIHDYERAVGPDTALLLKVHPSNYRIQGFTREVTTAELVELGRRVGVPVMEDLGSGFLIDLEAYGITGEPTVQAEINQGVDVVTFSGDKLLGGPQAGIIVGRRDLVAAMAGHPLTRALRIDKMNLAALEATLRAYRNPDRAVKEIPTLAALVALPEDLRLRAEELQKLLTSVLGSRARVGLMPTTSQAGGGSLPVTELPSWAITIRPEQGGAAGLVTALRRTDPPVLARVQDDLLLLDVRTLLPGEGEELARALVQALEGAVHGGES
ncbi:L-seryl-tRNA(Sec) selenium transferase [Neomoorella thermoacetica]|uniref:L-seryl-tRNA(Sec) selenium transferase n=4 Tax=Neomoorella thermoacetica TaxID=1525 RepID=SELA_NEOTH|nr:L-seryl-tRNA(Sec) selenium transferase [Moorella thermoacetica]O33277.1 RecName: Full=L-seryl-tRNA(Sec) selenium transferase; AltName: Full=Selenocysteine synthase; Short=Sec synthase; AltName: Full=Selenocysteinyl-tRNA(Sec) synthase [Moorella thermoacetica]Q2RFK3.1 RecName: Full=L-seryl-tRNA(Sec) selenium transferase; AltName: Full=Selenocysteine synthase; Short=Sec synthase; AltName: Full=Selenocysteinyl-tRNA(Sec) synthase [Moorella thermoacetica ATCC 39073]AKX95364.1 L-seryl-tRNA(Sec) sele